MKKILKTVLPAPIIYTARDAVQKAQLAKIPARDIQTSNLCLQEKISLTTIYADKNSAQTWKSDHEAITNAREEHAGWDGVNIGDRQALYHIIRTIKPESALEIGTHIGASTMYLARALKANKTGQITTVDILDVNESAQAPWKNLGLRMSPKDYAQDLDCGDIIDFVAQSSIEFLESTTDTYDLIFLDGDHAPQTLYAEIAVALKRLRKNGVILLHDYYPDARPLFPDGNVITGPFRALERIQKENQDVSVESLSPLPWKTKLGSHNTSLAILTKKS